MANLTREVFYILLFWREVRLNFLSKDTICVMVMYLLFQQTLPDTEVELPEVPGEEPEDKGNRAVLSILLTQLFQLLKALLDQHSH